MDRQLLNDLNKLRLAMRKVGNAAVAESKAVDAMGDAPAAEALAALHEAHHEEMGAIQGMLATLELFERRHAGLWLSDQR